jgi:hypothetical protein
MSLLDSIGDLLKRATKGEASEGEVHAAYDQLAGAVPPDALADGLSHTFKSDQSPPFEDMVSGLFDKSSPEQRADFVNHLLAVLGPAGVAQALDAAGIKGGSPGQISPAAMQGLARQAAAKDPSIIDRAASFYAQHPTLVKSIGVGALALLMNRINTRR